MRNVIGSLETIHKTFDLIAAHTKGEEAFHVSAIASGLAKALRHIEALRVSDSDLVTKEAK